MVIAVFSFSCVAIVVLLLSLFTSDALSSHTLSIALEPLFFHMETEPGFHSYIGLGFFLHLYLSFGLKLEREVVLVCSCGCSMFCGAASNSSIGLFRSALSCFAHGWHGVTFTRGRLCTVLTTLSFRCVASVMVSPFVLVVRSSLESVCLRIVGPRAACWRVGKM
jgi:hypothetical protein